MATATDVANNIRHRVHNDGFFWLDRNENLQQTVSDLKDLKAEDRNAAIRQVSDEDLKALADDVNANGVLGASGLTADEQRDLFNTLAQGLDGQQLGRLAKAFDDREDVMTLGRAVAQHADSTTKTAFIQEMAPRTADGDSQITTNMDGTTTESGDKEAEAILDVLGSMGDDPAAFNQAVGALGDKALGAVVEAGLNETMTTSQGGVSVSYDAKQLSALVYAASGSADPTIKARVLDAASGGLQRVRDNTGFPVASVGSDKVTQQLKNDLTALMKTDAQGITEQLNASKGISASTQAWLNRLDRWDNMKMYEHYTGGSGDTVSLTDMGLSPDVQALVTKDGAFGKNGSIQSRFIENQVLKGNYSFENAYEWGDELVWAMGGGMLKGEFKGEVVANGDGTFDVKGQIEYRYTDEFKDPYDTFDTIPGSWDPNGKPYGIEESWTVQINGTYPK